MADINNALKDAIKIIGQIIFVIIILVVSYQII